MRFPRILWKGLCLDWFWKDDEVRDYLYFYGMVIRNNTLANICATAKQKCETDNSYFTYSNELD